HVRGRLRVDARAGRRELTKVFGAFARVRAVAVARVQAVVVGGVGFEGRDRDRLHFHRGVAIGYGGRTGRVLAIGGARAVLEFATRCACFAWVHAAPQRDARGRQARDRFANRHIRDHEPRPEDVDDAGVPFPVEVAEVKDVHLVAGRIDGHAADRA